MMKRIAVAAVLVLLVAGFLLAQPADAPETGGRCAEWELQLTVANTGATTGGYLLCPNTGALWAVKGDGKKLVKEKQML